MGKGETIWPTSLFKLYFDRWSVKLEGEKRGERSVNVEKHYEESINTTNETTFAVCNGSCVN